MSAKKTSRKDLKEMEAIQMAKKEKMMGKK